MATKPVITPYVFALDATYTTGPVPLQGTATKIPLTVAERDEGWKADQTPGAQQFNDLQNHLTQWTNWVAQGTTMAAITAHIVETDAAGEINVIDVIANSNRLALTSLGWFGNGTGSITVVAGTTTLTADTYVEFVNISAGARLNTDGFRLFVSGGIDIAATGVIDCNGVGGSSPGAGGTAGGNAGSLGTGGRGGDSLPEVQGEAGQPPPGTAIGGDGGAGGDGGDLGGVGGTVTGPTTTEGGFRSAHTAMGFFHGGIESGATAGRIHGGAGGGAGGGDIGADSGGGGGGGGVCVIWTQELNNRGTISADGGAGGDATGPDAGGGGGGGGGACFVVFHELTNLGTIQAAGGAAGSGTGTGTAGSAGAAGTAISLSV